MRADLSLAQQAVQAAHASLESGRRLGHTYEGITNLILLSASNETAILQLENELVERGISCYLFREPDLNDAVTALATAALPAPFRKLFRAFSMWGSAPKDLPCPSPSLPTP